MFTAPAIAAGDETRDCIAIAKAKGATLFVGGTLIEVPAEGMLLKECDTAEFRKPTVRLHYMPLGGKLVVESYESSLADSGVRVSTRIKIGASIWQFIGAPPSRRDQRRPAGQRVTGIFSVRQVPSGNFYAVIFDPTRIYAHAEEPLLDLRLKVGLAAVDSSPINLSGRSCGVVYSGLINCERDSSTPELGAFAAIAALPKLSVGKEYVLMARDRPELRLTYVGEDWKLLVSAQEASAPVTSDFAGLERLLRQMALQRLAGDEQAVEALRDELFKKFPALVR